MQPARQRTMHTSTHRNDTMKLNDIPDVQSAHDARAISIDKVGIRSIRHPVRTTSART